MGEGRFDCNSGYKSFCSSGCYSFCNSGNYSFCSFSSRGVGRFRPEQGANPAIGTVGKLEAVEEERIETICDRAILQDVIAAINKVHPYEEVALDVYPLEDL